MITGTRASPSAASYEIICAEARTDPRSGYFDPDDQPARVIAYTASDDTASTYSTPMLRSVTWSVYSRPLTVTGAPIGITRKMSSAGSNAATGAAM